jgi:hypothetical protein
MVECGKLSVDKAGKKKGPNKAKQMAGNSEFCRDISARPTSGKYAFSALYHLSTAHSLPRRYCHPPSVARAAQLITFQYLKNLGDHASVNTICRCRRSGGVSLL